MFLYRIPVRSLSRPLSAIQLYLGIPDRRDLCSSEINSENELKLRKKELLKNGSDRPLETYFGI